MAGRGVQAFPQNIVGEQRLSVLEDFLAKQTIDLRSVVPQRLIPAIPKRQDLLEPDLGSLRHRRLGGHTQAGAVALLAAPLRRNDLEAQRHQCLHGFHRRLAIVFFFALGEFGIGDQARMLLQLVVALPAISPPIRQTLPRPDVVEYFRRAAPPVPAIPNSTEHEMCREGLQ